MDADGQGDGVSDPNAGGSESGGGAWKDGNEKPAHPDKDVVTHDVRETETVTDDGTGPAKAN